MLPEQQPQVDHRAVLADRCAEQACALAADPRHGWDLVHHDWGLRHRTSDDHPGITRRFSKLVDVARAAAWCLRLMLRVSVALHAAARRHTLRPIQF